MSFLEIKVFVFQIKNNKNKSLGINLSAVIILKK